MKSYEHILLATDLSPESELLADKAHAIAQKAKAKLSIVNVLAYMPLIYGGGEFAIPLDANLEESLKQQAKQNLKKQADRLGIPDANQYLQLGSTEGEILELAQQIKVDLIIVGSHNRHGLALLANSTADDMLHHMPCDILAVHLPRMEK